MHYRICFGLIEGILRHFQKRIIASLVDLVFQRTHIHDMQGMSRANRHTLRTFRDIDTEIAFLRNLDRFANSHRSQFGLLYRLGNDFHRTERTCQHTCLATDTALLDQLNRVGAINQCIRRTYVHARRIFALAALYGGGQFQSLDQSQSWSEILRGQIVFSSRRMSQYTCHLTGTASRCIYLVPRLQTGSFFLSPACPAITGKIIKIRASPTELPE